MDTESIGLTIDELKQILTTGSYLPSGRERATKVCPQLIYKYDQCQAKLDSLKKEFADIGEEISRIQDAIKGEISRRDEAKLHWKCFDLGTATLPITPKRWNTESCSDPIHITFSKIEVVRRGFGKRHSPYDKKARVERVNFSYIWPECGCEFHSFEASGRRGEFLNTNEAVKAMIEFMESFLWECMRNGKSELRCPRCQTCSTDLDVECAGYVEPEGSTTVETGVFLTNNRRIQAVVSGDDLIGVLP
jgi:hypothetical protein